LVAQRRNRQAPFWIPDFARITWVARIVIVLFDARPNESVRGARREFARTLRQRAADVRHAHLPDDDRCINVPDDLIAEQGDAALWRVIDGATTEEFTRDDHERIVANSLDNVRLALSKLGTRFRYDAFAREVQIEGAPFDDLALDHLWVRIDDAFHFRPTKDVLQTVVTTEAHASTHHPVRTYLDDLQWDGSHRLDAWLAKYAGAADTPYVRAVGALPLIAAVRRVREPGCKFDELLILESAQGMWKSSALRALAVCDAWFSDDLPLGADSKLVIERTAGKWIIEAAELHGNRGREAEQLKAFLSRQTDGPVRLAYGRLPVTVPRQFVLIGTTNTRLAYLKDVTGARRFWPVTIDRFDVHGIEDDRDQIWAEAAAREATRESIRLTPELWDAASEEQEDRRACDPWEAILQPLLLGDGVTAVTEVSADEIWDALKLEANHLDNRHADRVAAILQRHGYRKTRKRVNRSSTRCWVRELP